MPCECCPCHEEVTKLILLVVRNRSDDDDDTSMNVAFAKLDRSSVWYPRILRVSGVVAALYIWGWVKVRAMGLGM